MKTQAGYSKGILAIVVLLGMATLTAINTNAQTVTTDAVGFMTLPVTNANGGFQVLGLPLQPILADRGMVMSVASNTMNVACSTCATYNYGNATNQGYITFASGSGVGRYFGITANDTAGNLTLAVGNDNLSALLSGGGIASNDMYIIRPFWRLKDLFGSPAACTLQAGSKASNSDNVLIWSGSAFITAFPSSGANQWNVNGGLNDGFPIAPDEALMVFRRNAAQTNALILGSVAVTNNTSPLAVGFNFVSTSFAGDTTLDALLLTNSLTGFHGGTKAGNSDNVLIWNGSAFITAFFSTGSGKWNVNGALTNGYPILANSGFFVQNKSTGGYWPKPLPYAP